ncbi:MAG: lipocalin-like domain-containing protein [Proteobacteria bacterium]|nr:lipocalin-like domain-containing protein [Pseudomonadota bacterium]
MSAVSRDELAAKLIGAWRYIGANVKGTPRDLGPDPKGMIYYGPHGEMMVQIAPDVARKRAGAAATAEEAKYALSGFIAYLGTYTVDAAAGTVTHHRQASLQPGDDGDLVRRCEFNGDRLSLWSADNSLEVIWERIK